MKLRVLVPALALFASIASAQDASSMLQGGGKPLTIKPAALTADYHAVEIKTGSGGGGILDMLGGPMMMMFGMLGSMGGGNSDEPPVGLLSALGLSWTTGETQTFFGQYLVTYKIGMDMGTMAKMGPNNRDLSNMDLRLELVRTDAIQTFSPRPDVTPAMFVQMLKLPAPKPAKPGKP